LGSVAEVLGLGVGARVIDAGVGGIDVHGVDVSDDVATDVDVRCIVDGSGVSNSEVGSIYYSGMGQGDGRQGRAAANGIGDDGGGDRVDPCPAIHCATCIVTGTALHPQRYSDRSSLGHPPRRVHGWLEP